MGWVIIQHPSRGDQVQQIVAALLSRQEECFPCWCLPSKTGQWVNIHHAVSPDISKENKPYKNIMGSVVYVQRYVKCVLLCVSMSRPGFKSWLKKVYPCKKKKKIKFGIGFFFFLNSVLMIKNLCPYLIHRMYGSVCISTLKKRKMIFPYIPIFVF